MCSQGTWQLEKLVVQYCKRSGSSKGVRAFITDGLVDFAKKNPQMTVHAKHKHGAHPQLVGHYVTGQTRSVGVKNQDASDVARHAWRLRNQTGHRVVAVGNPVRSTADSVQGVWSPSHTFEEFSLKIDAESR